MESVYDKFKQAGRKIGLDTEKLNPSDTVFTRLHFAKFQELINELGIPIANYIGHVGESAFANFGSLTLTAEGSNRIRAIGKLYGNKKRANQLIELGSRNLLEFYLRLQFSDLLIACLYENQSRRWLAA